MSHYEESSVVRVFHVRSIICELSTCRGRLNSSFSALLFAMADFAAIVARRWHGLRGSSPFLRRFLDGLCFLAEILGCLRGIGRIDLFLFDLVFGHHPNPRRTFFLPTCWSLFGCGFLRRITLIGARRRREISPFLEQRFASRRTAVRGRRDKFAPSHHHRC